ncbi:MAG: hypothetical protein Tsb002_29140 [Wenzhouxiangellaceae bacterium]
MSIGLALSGGAQAQTATDDNFSAIKRSVPQALGNVLANDNGATDAQIALFPNRGDLDLELTGEAVYTPDTGSVCSAATDNFEYQNSTNQNALVNIDLFDTGVEDNFTVPAGQTLTGDVQSNDRLPVNALGDPVDHLDVVDFFFENNGAVNQTAPGVTNQTGQFTFTPDAGFSGQAGFEYQTNDPDLGCQANTVANILVTPVANQDAQTIPGAVETCGINVLANDLGSGLSLVSVTQSADGAASIEPGDTICFQPDADFAGSTSFNYTLQDGIGTQTQGQVNLTVQNQGPSAVDDAFETQANTPVTGDLIANDIDPNNDPLTVIDNTPPGIGSVVVNASGVFTYTPDTGVSGLDAFDYTAADGQGGESTATVDLLILPVAPDQAFDSFQGQVIVGNLLDEAIGTGLSVISTTQPATGILTVQPNGDFSFEFPPGLDGSDSFDYTISDTAGSEASGTVTLGIVRAPVAVPGLSGAPLGFLALLLGWLGWRRLD